METLIIIFLGDKKQMSETKLKQYMSQMDRELASTTLAQSFERKAPKSKTDMVSVKQFSIQE